MMYDIVRCFVLFVIIIGNGNIIIVYMFVLFIIWLVPLIYNIIGCGENYQIQYANN